MENRKETFEKKLALITSKLPPEAHLLIVSKNQSEADIKHYYELGHRDFGENRVQELIEKSQNLKAACPEIRWHMIGKLQTNKVNLLYTVPNLHAIHSVDNFSLIEKLVRSETRLDHDVLIFLQFNTSREVEKSGFENFEDVRRAADEILMSRFLKVQGLMTMGTLRTNDFETEARRCFKELQELCERLETQLGQKLQTSMGMSQDYEIALEEKSNWIRLGTMMFSSSNVK